MSSDITNPSKNKDISIEDFYSDFPVMGIKAEDVLAGARLKLLCDFPFFGKVSLNMHFVESEIIPTTAVNQKGTFFFNRKFVNNFDKTDAVRIVAHETMHLVQRFFARKPKGANHYLFNLAADYVLEVQLNKAGLPHSKTSKFMITPEVESLVERLGTVPAVYKHLLKEAEQNTECPACKQMFKDLQNQSKQQGNSSGSGDGKENEDGESNGSGNLKEDSGNGNEKGNGDCEGQCGKDDCCGGSGDGGKLKHTCGFDGLLCCSGALSDTDELDPVDHQKWMEKIIAAKFHAESKGNMPAGLGEYIDELTKSEVRWQDYIKTTAVKLFGRERYTFKRINRRGPALGIRLPGQTPDGKTAVGVIDTSASMSTKEVQQCISEFSALMKACGCDKLWLILHDVRVYFSNWVTEADLTNLKMARGGTSHIEVFQCLEKTHKNEEFNIPKQEEVLLAVLFTDLETTFPDHTPNFEVIWGVPNDGNYSGINHDVPFGQKVEVIVNE